MSGPRSRESRPVLRLRDGSALPAHLAAVHATLMRVPEAMHAQASRAAAKALLFRLPAMQATYPDGRRFEIRAGGAMSAQILVHGAYEPAESAVTSSLLREGDFAVDIGANFGWYSLLMGAAVGPGGLIWAVEPVPPMLKRLRENLALNPEAPVEIKPVALGAEPGVASLHVFEGLVHGHASMSALGRDDFVEHQAEVTVLDQLLGQQERMPALIKLDVEGAERSVLRGARRCIESEQAPIWTIEVNRETAGAIGYRSEDLIGELQAVRPHDIYRVEGAAVTREPSPVDAPHGTTWVCVPEARRDRVAALLV